MPEPDRNDRHAPDAKWTFAEASDLHSGILDRSAAEELRKRASGDPEFGRFLAALDRTVAEFRAYGRERYSQPRIDFAAQFRSDAAVIDNDPGNRSATQATQGDDKRRGDMSL